MSVVEKARRTFTSSELRGRIILTVGILLLYRAGAQMPLPGVNYSAVQQCVSTIDEGSVLASVNLFSGGALTQLSLMALGVVPFITASIIMQLLSIVVPKFAALKEEGSSGQGVLNQYARYGTVALAALQAGGLVYAASGSPTKLFTNCQQTVISAQGAVEISTLILAMMAGGMLAMWMGEQITERGLGNGISLILFASIAVSLPAQLGTLATTKGAGAIVFAVVGLLVLLAAVVFVEQGERRIPVKYPNTGGHTSYLPFKINPASVIPVIYASSMLYIPLLYTNFSGDDNKVTRFIGKYLTSGAHPLYVTVFVLMIIFFTYFQIAITHNPYKLGDQLNAAGGFIPGVRPGEETKTYLAYVLDRLAGAGGIYLSLIAVIPLLVLSSLGSNASQLPLGGTALLILVSVALETTRQYSVKYSEIYPTGRGFITGSGKGKTNTLKGLGIAKKQGK